MADKNYADAEVIVAARRTLALTATAPTATARAIKNVGGSRI
jgi:hypothetical protein